MEPNGSPPNEFFLVHLLEDRALVPGRTLELLERLAQVVLRDVHHADLEHLVGFGVVHQVVQAAPGAFDLLELLGVHDQVDLLRELLVERGDQALDRAQHVAGDQVGAGERLLGQRAHSDFDRFLGLVGLRLEFLLQQRAEVAHLERTRLLLALC
jgi:hypothetical protein